MRTQRQVAVAAAVAASTLVGIVQLSACQASTVPGAPSGLAARALTTTTAALSWLPPAAGAGAITGYRVSRNAADSGGTGPWSQVVSPTALTLKITALEPGSGYYLNVRALTAGGAGPVSTRFVEMPGASAPVNIVVRMSGAQRAATISWSAPRSTQGHPISGYRVERNGFGAGPTGAFVTTVSPGVKSFTFTDLAVGRTYWLSVRAVTAQGLGAVASRRVLLPVSSHSVWAWGAISNTLRADQVPVLSGVNEVSGGWDTGYALNSSGTVQAWGGDEQGQLGNGTQTFARVPTPVTVAGLTQITAIAGGFQSALALRRDGTVWAWGDNSRLQLGQGSAGYLDHSTIPLQVKGLAGVVAIADNSTTGYALKNDGTVWAWGDNTNLELGSPRYGDSNPTPVQVAGLSGVLHIAAGGGGAYALRGDGTVWAWGSGSSDQLGNGGTTDSGRPVRVANLAGVTAISGGGTSGYALLANGTVWAWGSNNDGELGNGNTNASPIPVQINGLSGITAISGGQQNAYALGADGSVWAWGSWGFGALGNDSNTAGGLVPTKVLGLTGAVAIAGGTNSGFAVGS